jgi:hypothetical protein
MKIFKSALSITLLVAASSAFAARTPKGAQETTEEVKSVVQPVKKATPAKKPAARGRGRVPAKQPAVKPAPAELVTSEIKTYKQLTDYVKNATNGWNDSTKQLNTHFVERLHNEALAADLEDYQYDSLLQMARDYHAIFTGDSAKDRKILNDLAQERGELVGFFNTSKKAKIE